MNKKHIITLGFIAFLAGCAAPANQTGQQLTDIVKAERGAYANAPCAIPEELQGQYHTILKERKFNVPIRVIFPGDAVTMDHVSNRLNFNVNKKGVIYKITCG